MKTTDTTIMGRGIIVSKNLAFYSIDFLFVRAIRTGTTTGASTSLTYALEAT